MINLMEYQIIDAKTSALQDVELSHAFHLPECAVTFRLASEE